MNTIFHLLSPSTKSDHGSNTTSNLDRTDLDESGSLSLLQTILRVRTLVLWHQKTSGVERLVVQAHFPWLIECNRPGGAAVVTQVPVRVKHTIGIDVLVGFGIELGIDIAVLPNEGLVESIFDNTPGHFCGRAWGVWGLDEERGDPAGPGDAAYWVFPGVIAVVGVGAESNLGKV